MCWWPTADLLVAHLVLLICKGVHAVFRLHQKHIVDLAGPRPCPARSKRAPEGMLRSRGVSACGLMDQVVEYFKPVRCPVWMSAMSTGSCPSRSWCVNCGIGSRRRGSWTGR